MILSTLGMDARVKREHDLGKCPGDGRLAPLRQAPGLTRPGPPGMFARHPGAPFSAFPSQLHKSAPPLGFSRRFR